MVMLAVGVIPALMDVNSLCSIDLKNPKGSLAFFFLFFFNDFLIPCFWVWRCLSWERRAAA